MVHTVHDGIAARYQPADSTSPTAPARQPAGEPRTLQVEAERGDTLASLGQRYGVSTERMAEANPELRGGDEPLAEGEPVAIPVDYEDGDSARAHTVEPGETLEDVASQYGVDADALAEANGLHSGTAPIDSGEELIVPNANALSEAEQEQLAGIPGAQALTAEEAREVIGHLETLGSGSLSEQLEALGALAKQFSADDVRTLLERAGVSGAALDRIAASGDALAALATLVDGDSSALDRAAAALTLLDEAGDVLGGGAAEFFDRHLAQLPNASKIIDKIGTLLDPEASAADKAAAALEIATTLQDGLGEQFPQLANRLRALDSITGSLGAAVTLLDPDASLQEKAQAAVQLYANVPDVAGDVERIRELLSGNGIPNADAIADEVARLPGGDLIPEALRRQMSPELVENLTADQARQIAELAARGEEVADALGPVLGALRNPEALDNLMGSLDGRSADSIRATLSLVGELGPDVADDLLTSQINGRAGAEVIAELIDGLPADSRGNLSKLLKEFDAGAARRLLEVADQAGPGAVGDLLRTLDGVNVDSALLGRMLNDAFRLLDSLGVRITAEVAQSLLRNVAKLIPIAGAVPAGYDTYRFTQISTDTSLPPELRYLALQGAKANAADAALSIAEAFGVTIPFTTAGSALIGVGSLVLDVVLEQQINQFRQDPDNWSAPGYVDGAIAASLLTGPQAFVDLALIFGPEGAVRKAEQLTNGAVDLTAESVARIGELQAEVFGDGLSFTADGLHLLADVIRDPSLLGDAAEVLGQEAVRQLNAVAEGAGELAGLAREQLGNLVGELKELGERGVEALGWIASNPGEAARLAADALGDLVEQGLELATDAGRALAEGAMTALETAHDALLSLGDAAIDTLEAVGDSIGSALDSALELGERGLEFVGWVAGNPGEAAALARDALVDVISEAGELATAAYDQLVELGESAAALADVAIARLADAGEAAVDTLIYIAENPVDSAEAVRDAAIEALGTLADGVGAAAERATDALVGFVDQGIESAKSVVTNLLTEGKEAAERIISAWGSELSEGAREVVAGLADVGDAGLEALGKLADAGIGFAGDVVDGLQDAGEWIWDNTGGRLPWP
ncbi:LysM peptidoglycan-binding domain-containing protein [Luteimonas sp. SJ-92]|uniref:LysM peptidoglycan-binding domain-containing protein n=1 Tax=Luteimonas salinisoli TaxID=2752307 RepID=A0A853JFK0_9GAMM|nr:LysM peptidoglycan-binding domain-containing protein [Luteimonas salinisoli]NZA27625.1 LysM peptidoglycan-binding domain-containing protein [Luteimonas salinisoli]